MAQVICESGGLLFRLIDRQMKIRCVTICSPKSVSSTESGQSFMASLIDMLDT